MNVIDADRYRKDLLSAYDDVSMEFEVLDRQPLVHAIPIPEGATNGEMIKAMFPTDYTHIYDRSVSSWWNAPYKATCRKKPTGSESEEE